LSLFLLSLSLAERAFKRFAHGQEALPFFDNGSGEAYCFV
jgi:hypothetical protein